MAKYIAPSCAVAMAMALLGLQIIGGLEYTEGASLYTRASMIAAMVAVAFMPLVIESAWTNGSRFSAAVMAIAVFMFLGYSIPATIGRTGEAKEAKVVTAAKSAEDMARIAADHAKTQKLVDDANAWQIKACDGGNGKNCKAATFVLNQRQASLEKLASQLEEVKPAPVGDYGSETIAWALQPAGNVEEASLRKAQTLMLVFGYEFGIFGMMCFAATGFRKATKATPATVATAAVQTDYYVEDPSLALQFFQEDDNQDNPGNGGGPKSKLEAEADLRTLLATKQPIPSQDFLAERWGVHKGTVSKWLRDWEIAVSFARHQRGRCKELVAG